MARIFTAPSRQGRVIGGQRGQERPHALHHHPRSHRSAFVPSNAIGYHQQFAERN
jgi:hypothetical protein